MMPERCFLIPFGFLPVGRGLGLGDALPRPLRLLVPTDLFQEPPVAALIDRDPPVLEDDQPLGQGVEEHLVVGDHDHGPVEAVQGFEQGFARFKVKVVGGLVEEEQIDAASR